MKPETYNRELAIQSIMQERLNQLEELLKHRIQGIVVSARKELDIYKHDKSKLRELAESVCDTIKVTRLQKKYPLEEQTVIKEEATETAKIVSDLVSKKEKEDHPWRQEGPLDDDLKRIKINRYLNRLIRKKPREIEDVEDHGSIGGTTKY